MRESISKKQTTILNFLKSEIQKNGYPPTIREICNAVNLTSTSTVHSHLRTLETKGYIRRTPSKNRSIEILDDKFYGFEKEYINVPILGKVTAGLPITAIENIEDYFPMPYNFIRNYEVFMLRVSGDSMVGKGIFDKDLVLIKSQSTADNGDIVVALLDDAITIKTFYHEVDHVRLQPANDAYLPIITADVKILGKLIGLYRKI